MNRSAQAVAAIVFLFLVSMPGIVKAHCDTLDGPVVATARMALEKRDVTPVLKWVKKDDEREIRELFNKTLTVRAKGKEARELADSYFFETLVRIHRAGEGAAYTGLKPAGQVEPSIAAVDTAIQSGSVDELIRMMNEAAAAGIRQRYARVRETKMHANDSVEAGRTYVEAYVDFTHYVERLDIAAASAVHHGSGQEASEMHEQHEKHEQHDKH